MEIERILDKRVMKKTRGKEYYEYIVKWKNQPVEDATWVNVAIVYKSDTAVEDLMDKRPWIFLFLGILI